MPHLRERTSPQKRSGMARVVKESHSFTSHPRPYLQMERALPAFTFPQAGFKGGSKVANWAVAQGPPQLRGLHKNIDILSLLQL